MNRYRRQGRQRVPRTGGDEPLLECLIKHLAVFPAQAGMNRRTRDKGMPAVLRVPRTGGDEPLILVQEHLGIARVPRTGGDEPSTMRCSPHRRYRPFNSSWCSPHRRG